MPDAQPFQYGDSLTIRHDGGREAQVAFRGLFGKRFDQAYVFWPLAGEYRVQLDTGQLTPRKVSVWRVIPSDLHRLRMTSVAERNAADVRMKQRSIGGKR